MLQPVVCLLLAPFDCSTSTTTSSTSIRKAPGFFPSVALGKRICTLNFRKIACTSSSMSSVPAILEGFLVLSNCDSNNFKYCCYFEQSCTDGAGTTIVLLKGGTQKEVKERRRCCCCL